MMVRGLPRLAAVVAAIFVLLFAPGVARAQAGAPTITGYTLYGSVTPITSAVPNTLIRIAGTNLGSGHRQDRRAHRPAVWLVEHQDRGRCSHAAQLSHHRSRPGHHPRQDRHRPRLHHQRPTGHTPPPAPTISSYTDLRTRSAPPCRAPASRSSGLTSGHLGHGHIQRHQRHPERLEQ